jgi:hypothetical protein
VAAGQWLGRTAGSTLAERRRLLPGDEIVDNPTVVEHVDPPRLLVLHSTTHVPAAWRARLGHLVLSVTARDDRGG